MIKAIIFDCFGVLTTDLWREFLADLSPDVDIEPARALNRAYDAGQISLQEFIDGVKDATGYAPQGVADLLTAEDTVKNTQLLDYIRELRAQGYKIGMISNIATNWVRDSFLTEAEQALFDVMTFSFEAGVVKPDPQIYRLTSEQLGVQSNQAVFIDDVDRFAAGAKEVGMQSIVYKDFPQLKLELAEILQKD